jgi:2-amino-4-hydroxy-6-hydroxymethyldihydropteridine diphosphokinase
VIAYLGLGSNIGDRLGHLVGALAGLERLGSATRASSVYETEPVGGPSGQRPYLNLVARLETACSALELLGAAQQLERAAGRERTARFGPRTLDVDLLLLDDLRIDEPDLVVPHPRMYERAFVLAPLEELDPTAVPTGWRERLGGVEAVDAAARRVLVLERGGDAAGWRARPVPPLRSGRPRSDLEVAGRPTPSTTWR